MFSGDDPLGDCFYGNDFLVYVSGSMISSGSYGHLSQRTHNIIFMDNDKKMLAEVKSTDPRSQIIRDHMALYTANHEILVSIDFQSTYGFFPKITSSVKDYLGREYASAKFDSFQFPYILVGEEKIISSSSLGELKNFNHGAKFYGNNNVVGTVMINKDGLIHFDGYRLNIIDREKLRYIIPCVILYLKNYGMISTV